MPAKPPWTALKIKAIHAENRAVYGSPAVHGRTLEALLPDREWTGRTGDARRALERDKALLLDLERVLGADHPDTLATRNNIAGWTAETGDARRALELFEALLPDLERVLGADHPNTRTTEAWTMTCAPLDNDE